MIKKKATSLLLIVCVLVSLIGIAKAIDIRASDYLVSYSAAVYAKGNGNMSVDVVVRGVTTMDKIGVNSLRIEEKYSSNGSWHYYDTLYGSDDPDTFYFYGERTFLNSIRFEGTPGYYYRVIATVYAGDSEGSDTGTTPSTGVLFK